VYCVTVMRSRSVRMTVYLFPAVYAVVDYEAVVDGAAITTAAFAVTLRRFWVCSFCASWAFFARHSQSSIYSHDLSASCEFRMHADHG